jgi:cytochrome P450
LSVRIAGADHVLDSSEWRMPAGSWVSSWLGASDRDPKVFGPDADRYNPYRTVNDGKVQHFVLA